MKRKLAIVMLIASVIMSTTACSLVKQDKSDGRGIKKGSGEIVSGGLPVEDTDKIKEELQKKVDESMLAIKINTNPIFETPSSEGNIMIENPERNNFNVQVEVTLDDTGEVVYVSPELEPNSHIANIKLDKKLKPGDYMATAMFFAYDDEGNHKGQAGAGIKINIGGE